MPHGSPPSADAPLPSRIVQSFFSPAILGMVTKVYIPMLFPLTFLIWLVSSRLDALLGFGDGFLPSPANLLVGLVSFVVGAVMWLWTYEQLTRMGEGSPSPTAGRTQKLVIKGIYAYCRNPSVWGKLFGVMAVGFVTNSFSFCFILVPLLLTGSLMEKVVRQEPQLVEVFGEDYEEYRKKVPLFVPWGLLVPGWKERRGL